MLSRYVILALSAASAAGAANSWIVPGAAWMSTSNTKIDAHGGMVYKEGDTFYWVGQSASHSKFMLIRSLMPYLYIHESSLLFLCRSNNDV